MSSQHPVTPSPEFRRLWAQQAQQKDPYDPGAWMDHVATQAAHWGADQELDACCELLELSDPNAREFLQTARRPKPPNTKQRGLTALEATSLKKDDPLLYQEILNAIEGLPDD